MKIDLQVVALAGCFVAGVFVSGLYYRSELADVKSSYAQAAEQYQAELRKKGEEYEKRLAKATDAKQAEIDRLNGVLISMRGDVERLRVAATSRRAVPRAKGSAGEPSERQDESCIRLLAESARLLEEGGGLLRDINADREGVRKLKK